MHVDAQSPELLISIPIAAWGSRPLPSFAERFASIDRPGAGDLARAAVKISIRRRIT